MMKRTHFFPLLIFVGIAALLTFACGQPAPAPAPSGPSAEEIRSIIKQEVANVPAPAP